ncbi:divisome-associated lipoprotein DalA [Phaeovulum vinaykumarii]|uniref:Cysteine-rich secretory protein family protein n=1 Tax=Phaeovulum vinaykumarii TaxID=407234 RepID=A0A1N7L0B0_9RHOB|nr:CAP domain-containing protein [Phaeovulum vinaykumarii]SIS67090.1 Cysteine-rich secretory protein family protein [Phaeovulum vinaykumarii]SOC00850.1 hypothetical protein SAMN05878426_102412 [Phaeovulum vinaykumarii]
MNRRIGVFSAMCLVVLAACAPPPPQLGPDGKPLPQVYRINPGDTDRIVYSMLDSMNTLRAATGAPALTVSSALSSAAAAHSRDMAAQNRPWHFGTDGSTPLDRARRAGYSGHVVGENISETYESETETLQAWMGLPDTRDVVMSPEAREMGLGWFQEPGGKIWWTLMTGHP